MATVITQNQIAEILSAVRFNTVTDGTNPIDDANTSIAGFGTTLDIPDCTNITYSLANAKEETTYATRTTTNGVTKRRAENSSTIDVVAGTTVAAGDAKDQMTFTMALNKTALDFFRDAVRNQYRIVCKGVVQDTSSNNIESFDFLGTVDGTFDYEGARVGGEVEITIIGGESYSSTTGGELTDYNTAMGSDLTAEGFDDSSDAITPPSLVADNYTELLAGEVTFTDFS